MLGTLPSSWCGAAHNRPGRTSYNICFAVGSLLQELTFSLGSIKFFQGLRSSASYEVQVLSRFLARDMQSVIGRNLWLVHELTNLNPWAVQYGKLQAALQAEEAVDVPVQDRWRLPYLLSLLKQRREAHNLVLENEEEALTNLINSLVIN